MKKSSSGFTLIEVMIAILIFALTAGAIGLASSQSITGARQIEEQTEARWVAQNYLTQLRLSHILPTAGKDSVTVEFNNKTWVIDTEVRNVEVELLGPYLRRIEIKTKLENDSGYADILDALLGEASS